MFVPSSHTRQLDAPRLVRIALTIAAKVCKMNFQVSFFFIAYHLPFTIYHLPFTIYYFSDYSEFSEYSDYSDYSEYSDYPPPELPSLEEEGWG